MKTIEKHPLSQGEQMEILGQGNDPSDYIALNIVAMGMQLQPQKAKVRESEESDVKHDCIICTIPFPLPLDSSILNQKKVIVPGLIGGKDNNSLELALAGIPIVRLVMKKDSLVSSLKD